MSEQKCSATLLNAEKRFFGARKATFCFLVACLFGHSHSLSSQPPNRADQRYRADSRVEGPTNGGNSVVSRKSSISQFPSTRDRRFNYTSSRSILTNLRLGFNESDLAIEQQLSPPLSQESSPTLPESFRQVRNDVIDQLRNGHSLDDAKLIISGMIEYLQEHAMYETNTTMAGGNNKYVLDQNQSGVQNISPEDRRYISETIDETFQAVFARAFAPPLSMNGNVKRYRNPGRDARHRVALGIELLQLQLRSSDVLSAPYHEVPKSVIVQALAAVTRLQESGQQYGSDEGVVIHPDLAFRLLQRLVTGFGVRNSHRSRHFENQKVTSSKKSASLYEVDFNRVLNIYSSSGRMEMAHRVIALQERTPHAPALSPVTYSILVKGYGKLCDAENIDMLLRHAASTAMDDSRSIIKPDTIFFNSLMDAYINCRQLPKARTILKAMILNDESILRAVERKFTEDDLKSSENDFFPFSVDVCPSPNLRSYNILLKGYAREGLLREALELAEEMKILGSRKNKEHWWDHVTTNTLVQAAVVAKEFDIAHKILDDYVVDGNRNRSRNHDHPNADAYTTLMHGYGKSGKLKQAISVLKDMQHRNVEPNEYHYSCLVGSLAREGRIDHAKKMLFHAKSKRTIGGKSQRVIYNAFISGLVQHGGKHGANSADDEYDNRIDKALLLLREMIDKRIMPDASTVAIILDGFGGCVKPRVKEAVTLVEKLETQGIIPTNHIRVTTALVRVCGACQSLDGAIACFRRIAHPDVAAVNALIDAAVRSGNDKIAVSTFNRYFGGEIPVATPDVISFSTLIGAYLKKGTYDGSRAARQLYQDMRFKQRILPDKVLVDVIVKGIIYTSRTCGVQASDARFVAGVLRDAEKLDWDEGQLETRKMAIESAMSQQVANAWEEEAELYGLWKTKDSTRKLDKQNMFERHGWNKVDSGFRLWGAGKKETEPTTDDFLESKGWNDMDSGFRMFF